MISRYRNYGQEDDLPMDEGDRGFVGIDQFSTAENLQPGMAQDAVNCDFRASTARTRGGFVCNPSSAAAPFGTTYASGAYSDPNSPASQWTVLVGATRAGFYAFGSTPRFISYPDGYTVSKQSTVVQANNYVFIFAGEGQTPLRWNGDWLGDFEEVPPSDAGAGFSDIPESNSARYYQNRLWVVNGKDHLSASDVLDFINYDDLANDFNLNTGTSDFIVTSYPFGDNGLVVFKHNSSLLLQNVQGSLSDVTATEITRQLGIVGINACVTVGPDLVYMSDQNITSVRLNLQNQLQAVTEPLSKNIKNIMGRVNWSYAYKVSMAYWDNNLYVAVPVDNSTTCNVVLVYNFVTQQWWGEWAFDEGLEMAIQGFVVANYFAGSTRLFCITEDGRIFVTGEGADDIDGDGVYPIQMSVTTRPYRMENSSKIDRRMYVDIETNRPDFSITSYTETANSSQVIISNQTYERSESMLFGDSPYDMNNANNDFNRPFREDYASGPDSVEPGESGILPEMTQARRLPLITRRKNRLSWFKVANVEGFINIKGVGLESRAGDRSTLTQTV